MEGEWIRQPFDPTIGILANVLTSWTTLYSLYADAILCFHPTFTDNTTASSNMHLRGEQAPIIDHPNKETSRDFIPDHVYKTQSEWYLTAMQKYGVSPHPKDLVSGIFSDTFLAPPRLTPSIHQVRLGVPGRCRRFAQNSHRNSRACGQLAQRNGFRPPVHRSVQD